MELSRDSLPSSYDDLTSKNNQSNTVKSTTSWNLSGHMNIPSSLKQDEWWYDHWGWRWGGSDVTSPKTRENQKCSAQDASTRLRHYCVLRVHTPRYGVRDAGSSDDTFENERYVLTDRDEQIFLTILIRRDVDVTVKIFFEADVSVNAESPFV